MSVVDRYDQGYRDAEAATLKRIATRLRVEAGLSPMQRLKLLELARRFADESAGTVTQRECPVRRCEAGQVVTRTPDTIGGSYSVQMTRCAYCDGTGMVTPSRYVAYDGPSK